MKHESLRPGDKLYHYCYGVGFREYEVASAGPNEIRIYGHQKRKMIRRSELGSGICVDKISAVKCARIRVLGKKARAECDALIEQLESEATK